MTEVVIKEKFDLKSFTSLMLQLHHTHTDRIGSDINFSPCLSAFHSPSRATPFLSVDFRKVKHLLEWLDVHDSRDHLSIGYRFTRLKLSGALRLLGSSFEIEQCHGGNLNSSTIVDCVLPFCSATTSSYHAVAKALSNADINISESADKNKSPTVIPEKENEGDCTLVLYRSRENYSDAQGKYLSPWKKTIIESPPLTEAKNSTTAISTFKESLYSVQWTPLPQVHSTLWTSDATYFGDDVMGEVTIFFPAVTFFGSSTIEEIRILSDDLVP